MMGWDPFKPDASDPFHLLPKDTPVQLGSLGARQSLDYAGERCDIRGTDALLNAQMGITKIFLIGTIEYGDWIDLNADHKTHFAKILVVRQAGDDKFSGANVETQTVGNQNCTDEDCG